MSVRTISTKLAIEGEAKYKQALSACNAELKTLKSSLALVESTFKGSANSMEALTAKSKALADMQAAQAKKVSELESALKNAQDHQKAYAEAAAEAGQKVAEYQAALDKLKDSAGDAQQEQADLTAELEKWKKAQEEAEQANYAAAKGVQNWQQQLNRAKIEQNDLAEKVQENDKYLDEAAKSADGCATSIDRYGKAVKGAADGAEDCADSVEDYGKAAKGAGDDTDSFADKLKNGLVTGAKAAATAIAAVGTAAVAGVKFLNDIAESTEEYRIAQGKLNTAFEAAGYSTETAKEAYQTLFSILGDTDTAAESAQLLAQLAQSEEDVATWGDIAAGVMGTFGDALPINSLIEASNETAKVGEVTGALADALNWVGISEDEFNEKLAACADEAERTDLITKTLSETYQNASDIFRENNAALMEANKAQAELDDTMARLGGTVAEVKAALTAEFAPALAEVADAFINLAEGTDGAEEELAAAIDNLIGKAAEKLPELLEFGTEIILNLLGGITNAAPQLAEGGVTLVTSLTEGLLEALPQIAEAASQLIAGLAEGIAGAAPELIPAAAEAVAQLVQALVDNVPLLADAALDLVTGLADGILEAVPVLLEAAPELIESLVEALLEAVPEITKTGVELLTALVEDLPEIIDTIVDVIPEIIDSVVTTLLDHLPELVDAGIELLTALVEDLPEIIQTITGALPEIVSSVVSTLLDHIPDIVETGVKLLTSLIDNLPHIIAEIVMALPEIITGMVEALEDGVSQFEDVGENLVRGLWTGIQSLAGWLWNKVSSWIQSIWDGITDFFGIASPSKQMAWVGEMLVEGLAGAVDANGKKAVRSVGKMTSDMMDEVNSESEKVSDALAESANAAIQGIVSGLDSQKDVMVSAYREVAKAAADGVLESLPSDVLTDSLQESKAACEKLLTTIKGERYVVESSAAALRQMLGVEEKSAAQKELISRKVAQLNEAVPTLGLAYNAVTDSINLTGEAIEQLVEKSGEQKEYEARVERLSELYTEQGQISQELEAAREALSQAEAEGADSVQVLQESVTELTSAQEANAAQIAELEAATRDYGDAQAAAAAHAGEMTSRIEGLIEEVESLSSAYEDTRKKALSNIEGQLGLFGDLDDEAGLSIDSMIDSLQGQVEYMRVYSNNIRRAMEMGVDEGIIRKLSDGKEESSKILSAIVQGGQKEIAALNREFERVELGKDAFAQTIAEMETDFRAKMGELVTDLNDAMNEMNMADAAYSIGVNNMLGLISGTESQRQALVDAYTGAAKDALSAYKREVGQASPSKKFEEAGSYDIRGMIRGVESQRAALEAAYADAAQAALGSMERHLSAPIREPRTVSREEQTAAILSAVSGREGGVVNHFHIGEMNVRSDADLDYIAQKLYYMQQRESRARGGGIL